MVLFVSLQVLGKVNDAVSEQANLGLGRASIGFHFLQAIFLENALLYFGGEFHRRIGVTPSWIKIEREKDVYPVHRDTAKLRNLKTE